MTSKFSQKNILVVDDLPENVRLLSQSLKSRNYSVRGVTTGEMALRVAQSNWPNLILLDIRMPEMDGYQVCKALKNQSMTRNIPIIFLTALEESLDKVRAFSVGGADYITKPFEIEELIARVEHQLALQSALAEIQNLNQNLESKVKERTVQLEQLNCILTQEIRTRQKTEIALKQAHQRLAFHVENSPLGVLEWDSKMRLRRWSQRSETIFGWSAEEVIGKSWQNWKFIVESDLEKVNQVASRLLRGEESRNICRNQNYRKDGTIVYCEWYNSVLLDEKGRLISILSLMHDISDRKKMEAQLVHDALHDTLTGLANRTMLMERLEVAIKHKHRYNNYQFAVLFLDLDRFKLVNDSLGHQIGDQLLLKVANLLQHCLREVDLVARLGGDEFVILLDDICGANEATLVAKRIQNLLSVPFQLEKHTVGASASIGIVIGHPEYCNGEELLRDADVAMYRAKEAGRAQYAIFDRQMHLKVLQQLQLESELRQAVLNDEFVLHYQPIMDLSTAKLVGFEALIRWQHPSGKLIFPNQFIPIAEENGLILEIGNWVLHTALSHLKAWEQKLKKDLSKLEISINISGKQLYSKSLMQKIDQALSQTGIDGHCIKLELTETVLIEKTDTMKKVLESIRERNIQLSIDDFGTGFSCMGYLNQFPINYLKIDKSFVTNVNSDLGNLAIIKAIIALSKNLNMKVIAEGVEEQSQLSLLGELDCDCAQGYLFSKPLDPESAQEWLMRVV